MDKNYKWLVFNDEKGCIERLEKASQELLPTLTETHKYGYFIKHPEKELWALPISEDYIYLFSDTELNEAIILSNDWFSDAELP